MATEDNILTYRKPVRDKRFWNIDDLAAMPAPVWMVEGLFEANSLTMLAGPPASFKSFLLLDWLLCMATGRNWNGKRVAPAKVAYVLGEGKSSLFKRITAWLNHNPLNLEEKILLAERFKVSFDVPQMASKLSVDNFLADLVQEDFKPDVIAIDTFARAMVGMDENDQKDVGLWVEQADRLRQSGFTVIFLHHTKKNTEFGVQYRGSSAIMGAMDTAMTLTRQDAYCTLHVEKQKDHDEGPDMRFRRLIVGANNEDEACVLVPAPVLDERFTKEAVEAQQRPLSKTDEIIMRHIQDPTFPTTLAKAESLAKELGIGVEAARSKLRRK